VLDAVAGLSFLAFALLCGAVARAQGDPPRHRRRAAALSALVALVGAAAGFSQRDLWPFSRWNYAAGLAAPRVTTVRLVVMDRAGVEHMVDPRALEPLPFDELRGWLLREWPRLDARARERVAASLLARVEASRARAARGGSLAAGERLLGPLAAPSFVAHPRQWSGGALPPGPLSGLRLYVETWNQEARRRQGAAAVERRLEHELRTR
jgi:hypothetical protein